MHIRLEPVADRNGGRLPVEGELDFSFADLGRGQSFASPVRVSGEVCNRAGALTLSYRAAFALCLVCDRCLAEFRRDFSFDFTHDLVTDSPVDERSEAVFCPDGVLDLQALGVDDILPELPAKVLCKPDCKGLCPVCGADRNAADCGHGDGRGGDPRWDALRGFK